MAAKSKSNNPDYVTMKVAELKQNPNNPREISKDKFKKLIKSIREFPEMLKIRPLVINQKNEVLGGNMRLKALIELGIKEAPVIKAQDLTEEQQREFIVKDNISFGQWDWDELANDWDNTLIEGWGLDVWTPEEEADYSVLDEDEEIEGELTEKEASVKKAIQIEFSPEQYEEAFELIKFWQEREANVGEMILEHLKKEKSKL